MPEVILNTQFLPWLLLFGFAFSLLLAVGALLFDGFTTQVSLQDFNEPAGARIGFLEPTLAVLILFAIAISWLRYGDLVDAIQAETANLSLLGRSTLSLTEPQRSNLVLAAATYADALGKSDWPEMAISGRGSARATDALQHLTQAHATAHAGDLREEAILRHAQHLIRKLAEQREARLSAASHPFGPLVHWVMVIAISATAALSWFFGLPSLRTKLLLSSLFAFALAVPFTLNYVLVQAFDGPAALNGSAYAETAQTLRRSLATAQAPAALLSPAN